MRAAFLTNDYLIIKTLNSVPRFIDKKLAVATYVFQFCFGQKLRIRSIFTEQSVSED